MQTEAQHGVRHSRGRGTRSGRIGQKHTVRNATEAVVDIRHNLPEQHTSSRKPHQREGRAAAHKD